MQKKTIAVNYIVTIWNLVSVYLFLPINVKLFGAEAFGVISYAATVQSVLALLDFGVSTALKREFAVESDRQDLKLLLRSIEWIAVMFLGALLAVVFFLSPFISPIIIQVERLPKELVSDSFVLMVASAIFQIFFTIYQGVLWGMGRINQANYLSFFLSLFKNGAVVLVVWSITASLTLFLGFQLVVTAIFAVVARRAIANEMGKWETPGTPKIDWGQLQTKVSFAGGVFLISLLAVVNAQMDKILLGAKLPLTEFSTYYIAFTLSQMPVILTSPMLNVFFPKLSKLYAEGNKHSLGEFTNMAALAAFFLAANILGVLVFANKNILMFWLENTVMVEKISELLPFLAIGGGLQSFTILPYLLSLAAKDAKTIIHIQVATAMLSIPVTLFFIDWWGAYGAASSWCLTNIAICPIYVFVVLNKRIGFGSYIVYVRNAMLILLPTLVIYWFVQKYPMLPHNLLTDLIAVMLSGLLSYGVTLAFVRDFSHQKILAFLKN